MGGDKLLTLYLQELEKGVPQTILARESGVPVGSLRVYKRTGRLGSEYRARLTSCLEERRQAEPRVSRWGMLAGRLRALANTLESDVDDTDKQDALRLELNFLGRYRYRKK
jgi:hypothetical protein